MSLRDQLQAIYEEKGRLDPQTVVDVARPKSHPLHDRFEWNNTVAGEAWRREQAHRLIQKVQVVYREATESEAAAQVRAFHAVRDGQGVAYEPADKVAQDPLLSAMVLRDMEREWLQMKRRYGAFSEFVDMVRNDPEVGAA